MKSKTLWILTIGFLSFSLILTLMMAVFFAFRGTSSHWEGHGDIAVIEVEGTILQSKKIVEQLGRVEKNDRIQGLLLRVNSPGGSVGASQEIYQAVKRIRQKKKVVVSMGSIAASGGYYIALGADQIVANAGTITGSIGVLMDYTNVEELLAFLKLHAEVLTAGNLKDAGSPLKPLTPEDRAYLQSILDNLHKQFQQAVVENRDLEPEEVEELTRGQVFTGTQAKAAGLIDQLGNQQDAIDLLANLLEIEGEPRLIYPKKEKVNYMDLLMSGELESHLINSVYALREKRFMYLAKGIYQ